MDTEAFFEEVDGWQDPLAIIATDIEWPEDEKRPWLSRDDHYRVTTAQRDTLDNVVLTGWINDRGISERGSNTNAKSYEEELGIKHGSLKRVLNELSKKLQRKVSVLDYGCGTGKAIKELADSRELTEILGITLHIRDVILEVRNLVLAVNATKIKPKINRTGPKRFDTVLSIFGAAHYSPLNKKDYTVTGYLDRTFGILQAINLLEMGGVLAINISPASIEMRALIESGILRNASEFQHFTMEWESGRPPNLYWLERRPNATDIKSLLKLENQNMYSLIHY